MWSKRALCRQQKLRIIRFLLRRLIFVIVVIKIALLGFNMVKTVRETIELTKRENDMMKKIDDRMVARRRHLKAECARNGLDSSRYNASTWEFLVNREYHIIWCHVFKAGSSSWLYNFNIMANYSPEFLAMTNEIPVQLARRKYPRPTLDIVKEAQIDSKTFIIVRHPLERLASAYVDKIVHAIPKTKHYIMRLLILKYYRKDVFTKKTSRRRRRRSANQTTPLIKGFEIKKIQEPNPYRRTPLFEEFVSYILDEAKSQKPMDMHWMPYTSFCTPCKINFDIILKMETLDEDQKYLIKVTSLTGVAKTQWLNKRKTNSSYINSLYSRISKKQLDGLYKLYRYDLQLFNYSIDNYYDVVNHFQNKRTLTTEQIIGEERDFTKEHSA